MSVRLIVFTCFLSSFTNLLTAADAETIRRCRPDEFACDDGACLNNSYSCDGISQCADGSDERNCKDLNIILSRSKRADSKEKRPTTDCGVEPTPEVIERVGVPWHVGVYSKKQAVYEQICAGSLVSRSAIISAAHCFWDQDKIKIKPASEFAVAVGKRHRQWDNPEDVDAQKSDVKQIIAAPNFSGAASNFANDIAVVKLIEKIEYTEFVMPLCVYEKSDEVRLQSGDLGKIAGWGVAPIDNKRSDVVKTIDFPYLTFTNCIQSLSRGLTGYLTRDKMCAGFSNGTNICRTDGGAGLAFLGLYRGRTRYYLRGVLSIQLIFKDLCGVAPVTGYTRTPSHVDLITKNIVLDYRLNVNGKCGNPPTDKSQLHGGLPWQVAIYTRDDSDRYMQICAGALVDSNIVLTVAHCVLKPTPTYAVAAGKRFRQWDHPTDFTAQKSNVTQIKIGPRFNGFEANYTDDIALLFLETAIQFNDIVWPVCVNFDPEFDSLQIRKDSVGKMSGFGVTVINEDISATVNTIDMPVSSYNVCLERVLPKYSISTDKICGGHENGTLLCLGDSGTGLSFLDEYLGRRRYYLRGLLSSALGFGNKKNNCGKVTTLFFTWLLSYEQFLGRHVDNTPRGGVVEETSVTTSSECGVLPFKLDPLSIGGRPANYSEVPWHAGIYQRKKNQFGIVVHEQICGGSLINTWLILSAAHCFATDEGQRKKTKYFAVALGKLFREWDDPREQSERIQKSNISQIILPENYNGAVTRFQADIAIVKVANEVQLRRHIVPVCLDFDYEFDNKQLNSGGYGKVAGWGYINEEGVPSPVLKVVEEPIYNSSTCFAAVPITSKELITTDKICGGYVDGSQALCKGDSGGGLVVPSLEGGVVKYYLRGIVSTATVSIKQCNRFSLTYFTRVRAHQYLITGWLRVQTGCSNSYCITRR